MSQLPLLTELPPSHSHTHEQPPLYKSKPIPGPSNQLHQFFNVSHNELFCHTPAKRSCQSTARCHYYSLIVLGIKYLMLWICCLVEEIFTRYALTAKRMKILLLVMQMPSFLLLLLLLLLFLQKEGNDHSPPVVHQLPVFHDGDDQQ